MVEFSRDPKQKMQNFPLFFEKTPQIWEKRQSEVGRPVHFQPGLTISFFGEIPIVAGNEISAEISLNFAISERRGNLNSKNEILMYTGEISVISAEIWCPEGEIRCLWTGKSCFERE